MLAFLLIYALLLIVIGALVGRQVKSADDFLVARRELGPGLIFTTLLAANIGAGSTVGAAGLGYQFGLSAWWWVGSAGIGSLILAFTVGPKIWRLASRFNLYTVGDYLEHRYHRRVRVVVAFVLWLGTLTLLSGQLIAVSLILEAVAGVEKGVGCVIGGIVVTCYFMAGGLLSSAWVNLIQLGVMVLGFLVTVPVALHRAGGWQEVAAQAAARFSESAPSVDSLSLTGAGSSQILAWVVLLVPAFVVSPGLLQKIYGAKGPRAVRLGVAGNGVCLLLFASLPPLVGIIAASEFPGLDRQELALPTVMATLLPPWLGGLALAAVLSAELSTSDAILFMLSTSLSVDVYKTYVNRRADSQMLLRVNRIAALAAGGLGVALALALPSIISALTIFYGLLVVSLCVPLIGGLYWAAPQASSVMVAIILSVAVTLVFHHFTGGRGIGWLSPQVLGILVSLGIIVIGAGIQRRRRVVPGVE